MSITTHIKTLNEKHKQLEEELHNAYIHHLPTTEISRIKKQKLLLKDEIKLLRRNVGDFKKAA